MIIGKNGLKELQHGEPALGLKSDSTYNEYEISLESQSMMLVYSDGVTEARNDKGEFFGEQRLTQFLKQNHQNTSEKIGRALLSQINGFVGNARQNDDLSMIVLKRI